ncbi:hypothetical protein BDY24DRAFT_380361 [Mrakia frigida]|uniref:uncharacterized protein n=1 Tax=Mrakia frigida TaxID=29902 RepID=UPI003FCC0050
MDPLATPTLASSAVLQSTPKPKRVVTATNLVSWEGAPSPIRARIDPTLNVKDIVRQLCVSFQIVKPPLMYGLRVVEDDSVVTDENIRRIVEEKKALKITDSSAIMATSFLTTLTNPELPSSTLKLTLFNLQRYIKEQEFCEEFVDQGGDREMVKLIKRLEGNSLAYALQAIQGLSAQSSRNLSTVGPAFVSDIIQVISSPVAPINISRPATSILRSILPGAGFDLIYASIREQPAFLQRVVGRLSSPEGGEVLNSLMLINSLLSSASDGEEFNQFMADLDKLDVRKDVQKLMSPPHQPDLQTPLLDFQSNILRATFHLHRSSVDTSSNPLHRSMLEEIWSAAGLGQEEERLRWSVLGLDVQAGDHGSRSSRVVWKTGRLGLNSLHSFATGNRDEFSRLVIEQLSRPEERRCPIGRASNETVELLLEFWEVSDNSISTDFTPLLLSFPYVHSLVLRFFIRMWNDSSATIEDLGRVCQVVKSQVEVVLKEEEKVFARAGQVEKGFGEEVAYKVIRERMLREVEEKDDLMGKAPIRNLRNALFEECFTFVKQQRINCLLEGSWFMHGTSIKTYAREPSRNIPRGWTFIRLAPNRKSLGYLETQHQHATKPTMEDLNERIDISLISEIALRTSYPTSKSHNVVSFNAPGSTKGDTMRPSGSNQGSLGGGGVLKVANDLSFSLLAGGEMSLLDVVALDRAQFSEWTDGLNLLRSDQARVATQETKDLIEQLTDIGLKLKLLDLSGEMVSIPTTLIAPPPPSNVDFFFD